MDDGDFIRLLAELYGDGRWPQPLHLLQGAGLVQGGEDLRVAARAVATSAKRLEEMATAPNPVKGVLGAGVEDLEEKYLEQARNMLGQLVLGRSAELDMHFSLSRDLIPLRRFLSTLRESGSTKVTTLLERGEF